MATQSEALHAKPGKRLAKKKSGKWWLVPLIGTAAAAAAFGGVCAAAKLNDAILPNTYIAGQAVGGLTETQAEQVLEPYFKRLASETGVRVVLEDGKEAAYLDYSDLGVGFDVSENAASARRGGHTGNLIADGWSFLCTHLGRETVLTPTVKAGSWDEAATKLADACEREAEDFSYEASNGALLMTKARDGLRVDRPALTRRLAAAGGGAETSVVELPYLTIPAEQGDVFDLQARLGGETANASYDAETDSIIPERSALLFDASEAQRLLDAADPGETVSVPATTETPEVTAQRLEEVLFRDVLGTYTTKVSGTAERRSNVRLVAERVNGYVMNSGETFDYVAQTSPYSLANGYLPAPGYLYGKTVDTVGGGVCQGSSTIFAAALYANLEIVSRTAHGFESSYIPKGMDATVASSGPNFVIRNNTPYPVKLEAVYSDKNRLTVNLLGTKTDGTYVYMDHKVLSETPYGEQIIESPDLAPGERVVEQTPYTGYLVKSVRCVYSADGALLEKNYEYTSRYNARDRIVLVGAPAPEPEPPQSANNPAEVELQPIDDRLSGLVQANAGA